MLRSPQWDQAEAEPQLSPRLGLTPSFVLSHSPPSSSFPRAHSSEKSLAGESHLRLCFFGAALDHQHHQNHPELQLLPGGTQARVSLTSSQVIGAAGPRAPL